MCPCHRGRVSFVKPGMSTRCHGVKCQLPCKALQAPRALCNHALCAGAQCAPACTPPYAPPETVVAAWEEHEVTVQPACDVWALGVVGFEAITQTQALTTQSMIVDCARGYKRYPWCVYCISCSLRYVTHASTKQSLSCHSPSFLVASSALCCVILASLTCAVKACRHTLSAGCGLFRSSLTHMRYCCFTPLSCQ